MDIHIAKIEKDYGNTEFFRQAGNGAVQLRIVLPCRNRRRRRAIEKCFLLLRAKKGLPDGAADKTAEQIPIEVDTDAGEPRLKFPRRS